MGQNPNETFTSSLLSQRSSVQVGFEVFFAVVILLASVAGNSLVIYAIHKYPKLNTVTNILIENLAVTDICMAVLHMPFWITTLHRGKWVFGDVMCEAAGSTMLMFGAASLSSLAMVALNRYLKVVKRHLYRKMFKERKTTRILCVISWTFSALVATPPAYGWGGVEFVEKFATCALAWRSKYISYIMVLLIGALFVPTILIFYAYIQIYRLVRSNTLRMESHYQPGGGAASLNRNAEMARKKSQNQVLLTSFVVVCVYLVCWTPICIVGLSSVVGSEPSRGVSMVAIYLMFCSSFANPIVYGILNPRFKDAFADSARCFRRDRENDAVTRQLPGPVSKQSST